MGDINVGDSKGARIEGNIVAGDIKAPDGSVIEGNETNVDWKARCQKAETAMQKCRSQIEVTHNDDGSMTFDVGGGLVTFRSEPHRGIRRLREALAEADASATFWQNAAHSKGGTVDTLQAENKRLREALARIEGGDAPCTDEKQLRQWAYEAVTLGHDLAQGKEGE